MNMNIVLHKEDCTFPIYMSIANTIDNMVKSGALKPNDKLPTERQLSTQSGISRGTIKAAFTELQKRGVINTIQGSGSFVCKRDPAPAQAMSEDQLIASFFQGMRSLGFTLQEIEAKFTKRLVQMYDQVRKVNIAWVDVCPEFIHAAMKDTAEMRCITIQTFLYDEVYADSARLAGFDLLVRGWNDEDFTRQSNVDIDRQMKITMNLKMSCIINLAKVDRASPACLWCSSQTFERIMREALIDFDNISVQAALTGEDKPEALASMLHNHQVLLAPPELMETTNARCRAALDDFLSRGGTIIPFEYHIDRGSFVHLEDMVREIFYTFNEKPLSADADNICDI